MMILNKNDIQDLYKLATGICVSIYIPTHREGEAVNQNVDKLHLKNCLQEVDKELSNYEMNELERGKFLKKVWRLADNNNFWRHQSDGLAIFIGKELFKYYELPLRFKEDWTVSNKFYLKPLIPMLTGDGRFFVLAFNRKLVKMFECTRYSISEVYIADLVPKDMENALRYDNPKSQLQFKTGQGIHDGATFHGHGAGKDNTDVHIKTYCRLIDKGLMKMLHDEDSPLLLITEDRLASAYKSVNSYTNLLESVVNKNPNALDTMHIHELAWEEVESYFLETKKSAIEEYEENKHMDKTLNKMREIISAGKNGRIGKLLIVENGGEQTKSPELINEAVMHTIINGGEVFIITHDESPEDNEALAVSRY